MPSVSFASWFVCNHSDYFLFGVGSRESTTKFIFPIELVLYNSSFPSCNGASHCCCDARVWHHQVKQFLFLQHLCWYNPTCLLQNHLHTFMVLFIKEICSLCQKRFDKLVWTTLSKNFKTIWINKFYAIFTSPNQFLLDWGIGLVVFGTDWTCEFITMEQFSLCH